ncbi:zinc ribbon domain-containing protein [bacterium]|nr:zinc ribbon domain-containing protein [bacterium]
MDDYLFTCSNCNNDISEDDNTCPYCGEGFEEDECIITEKPIVKTYNKRFTLSPSPRKISFPVKIYLILGNYALFYVYLTLLMLFIITMIFKSSELHWSYYSNNFITAKGNITETGIEKKSDSNNSESIRKISFEFKTPENEIYSSISFTNDTQYKKGDLVNIEYIKIKPELSRISGTKSYKPWNNFSFGFWGNINLIFYISSFITMLKFGFPRIKLLEIGELAEGKLVKKEDTEPYQFTFSFMAANGIYYEVAEEVHPMADNTDHLEDDLRERVLYLTEEPKKSLLLDNLPGKIEINESGNFYSRKPDDFKKLIVTYVVIPFIIIFIIIGNLLISIL